ncbi:hypothetical protein [Blastococcus sp. SYSU D00820]
MTQPPVPVPPPPTGPTTRELPLPGATAPAGATAVVDQPTADPHPFAEPRPLADDLLGGVQPTGPVEGLPGGPPPAAAPETSAPPTAVADAPAEPRKRTPLDRAALLPLGLGALSLLLLQVGLVVGGSAWRDIPLWSGFATLATLAGLVPALARLIPGVRVPAEPTWRIAAGGLTGVAMFWVLVVLPHADSDRGFLLTAALAALGAVVWIAAGPRRR